jgi:hypothetical protein
LYQSRCYNETVFFCLLLLVITTITKNAFYFLLFSYLNMSMNFYCLSL